MSSKKKRFEIVHGSNSPKNQRYFFAYSERMIFDKSTLPFAKLAFGLKQSFEEDELGRLDFPLTALDKTSKYGLFIIPQNHLPYFLKNISHSKKDIGIRYICEPDNGLCLLVNWDIRNSSLTEDIEFILNGSVAVPYRMPKDFDLGDLLKQSGYLIQRKFGDEYIHRKGPLRGLKENILLSFYSMPLYEGEQRGDSISSSESKILNLTPELQKLTDGSS